MVARVIGHLGTSSQACYKGTPSNTQGENSVSDCVAVPLPEWIPKSQAQALAFQASGHPEAARSC